MPIARPSMVRSPNARRRCPPVVQGSSTMSRNHSVSRRVLRQPRQSSGVAQSAPFRRDGIAGRSRVWIRLTEPGGKSIHINLGHVTTVRSDTQIPGAKAQLDLTSGKFQGVQESVEQVMRLILATPGAAENDEPGDML